jgi:dsDNA-specific endonuclease/ATPase MutS2
MVLKFELELGLEQEFREFAMKRYGYKKGALMKAIKEAINQWIQQQPRNLPKVDDPINLITGGLDHLKGKISSVELQKEAMELWVKKFS